MKQITQIALIFLTFVFVCQSAYSAVLTNNQLKADIKKAIVKEIQKSVKGEINVEVTKLPVSELALKDGKVSYQVSLNTEHLSSRTISRISVLVDGQVQKTMGVPIELSVKDYAYVATEQVKKGSCLNSSNVELVKLDVTRNAADFLGKKTNITEYVASRNIRPGDLITKLYIKPKPDVKKNSMVSVIFKTKGINIAIDAQAMTDGVIGDYIKVKSHRYRKYYTGKIVSKNKVIVYI